MKWRYGSGSLITETRITPIKPVRLFTGGRWRTVYLKLEMFNQTGSSKDRTAAALIADLQNRFPLKRLPTIIESTSGNLGIALAFLCRNLGLTFIAVIDPNTTPENCSRMLNLGAKIEMVQDPDESGGYLLSRLRRVKELCSTSPSYVWTDQYTNTANSNAHFSTTAPEIHGQMDGRVDAIFVAVSTGGTLAGIGRYFHAVSPSTTIIAVDAHGSVIFGGRPGPRKLTGIGSSRRSFLLRPDHYSTFMQVTDFDAFSVCRQLDKELCMRLGGSSGAVLFACAQYLRKNPTIDRVVCVCPDGGDGYNTTIFDDAWLICNGFSADCRTTNIDAFGNVGVEINEYKKGSE